MNRWRNIFIALIFAGLIFWLKNDISARALRVHDGYRDLTSELNLYQSVDSLKEKIGEMRTAQTKLKTRLISENRLAETRKAIESLAKKYSGAPTVEWTSKISSRENHLGELHFNLSTQGTLKNIFNFLTALEKENYWLTFNRASLIQKDKEWQLSASAKIFYE